MSNYKSPTMSGIGFEFTTGGYTSPSMQDVNFNFGAPTYQQTADLQAAINVLGLYQTSTYTYTKECPTYVVGYNVHGIQIIKSPCIYGGIRDLGVYIHGNPEARDLIAEITALLPGAVLSAYIKGTIRNTTDLFAYIKGTVRNTMDLPAQILGEFNVGQANLISYLQAVPPKDLSAYLNVIEIRGLLATIQGDLFKSSKDLGAVIYKIVQSGAANLSGFVHGYSTLDLFAQIGIIYYKDLTAYIRGIKYIDLNASLYAIAPVDMYGFIHGYDTKDLSASLIGGYGPNDLRGYLISIPPTDLQAYIGGYKGIKTPFDLRAIVDGYYTQDLFTVINVVAPINLLAYLNAVGKTMDLPATIFPMVIHLKKVLNVALLEHNDLWAIINAHCFNSGTNDLSAYVYPLMKSDIKACVVGWKGGTADTINDLAAYINVSDYMVEDNLNVKVFLNDIKTQLKLSFQDDSGKIYNTFDTLCVKFGNFISNDLSAYIYGLPTAKDLNANINVLQQLPYRQAPEYVKIKNREVIINIDRFEPQWSRVAELFFDNYGDGDPFYYFYVEGENKVYRLNRDKHWIVRAVGYTKTPEGYNVDRLKIWRKYIFDMSKYTTIDEAIRDLIDRVAFFRRNSLSAYIKGVLPPHKDLNAFMTVKSYYHWAGHLTADMKIFGRRNADFSGNIVGSVYYNSSVLSASIIGDYAYTTSSGDNADFSFTIDDVGYSPPAYDASDYNFNV